jgi:hypothetical protein
MAAPAGVPQLQLAAPPPSVESKALPQSATAAMQERGAPAGAMAATTGAPKGAGVKAAAEDPVLLALRTATARLYAGPPGLYTQRAVMEGTLPQTLAPHLPSSPYVAALYELESKARSAVSNVVDGVSASAGRPAIAGMRERFGFHSGRIGGSACAKDAIVADLIGSAGAVPTYEQAVSRLHESTFSNYLLWAAYVGASPPVAVAAERPEDIHLKLCELALWYLIKTEIGNLRFCPELMCWLHHQMKRPQYYLAPRSTVMEQRVSAVIAAATGTAPVPPGQPIPTGADVERMVEAAETVKDLGEDLGFFHTATVKPLYDLLKASAAMTEKKDLNGRRRWLCCCVARKPATGELNEVPIANFRRPNYDDLNERFWRPDVLGYTYHNLDNEKGVQRLAPLRKTYRERSSYLALFTNFFPYWQFTFMFFLVCLFPAITMVDRGGTSFGNIGLISFGEFLERASIAMLALAAGELVTVKGGSSGPMA